VQLALAERSQLPLRLVAPAYRAAVVERRGRDAQLGDRALVRAGATPASVREIACER
jgi:hypothetical protein